MSCSRSAAEMGNCSQRVLQEVMEALEKNFEELQCLHRVKTNSINNLIEEYNKLSKSYNEEFEKLICNTEEEVKKIWADKRAEQSIRKPSEDQKERVENFGRRILELQKELDAEELELFKQHKATFNVIYEANKSDKITKILLKKNDVAERCEYLKELNETLTVKGGKIHELEEARKELLYAILELPDIYDIGVKVIGELDFTAFVEAVKKKHTCEEEEACNMAKEIFLGWEENLRDPDWRPLKIVTVDGRPKEIIDEEDQKLNKLKKDYGKAVYNAVTTALTELMEYNPIGRRARVDIWNYRQNRVATLDEGTQHLMKLMKNEQDEHPAAPSFDVRI